ncbi:hypothetical protein [Roseibium sp.]|uniref:hypothetical protein n=1 Tax=Roseibium sp. TaxID=1936156 RepID=UPI003BA93B51
MKGACEKKWIFFIQYPAEYFASWKDAGNSTQNTGVSGKKIFLPACFDALRRPAGLPPLPDYRLYLQAAKPYKRRRMPLKRPVSPPIVSLTRAGTPYNPEIAIVRIS